MEKFIDLTLSALFKFADFVTSKLAGGKSSKTTIRFSKEDAIID